jgi:PhnB protein
MVNTSMVPFLCVSDVRASITFYEKALGFTTVYKNENKLGVIVHAELTFENCKIMIAPPEVFDVPIKTPKQLNSEAPITLHIHCDNVDSSYDRAVTNGAKILAPPKDMAWGERMYRLLDIDGYSWMFWSEINPTSN